MNKKLSSMLRLASFVGLLTVVSASSHAVHDTCWKHYDPSSCKKGQCEWVEESAVDLCTGELHCYGEAPPCPTGCTEESTASSYCTPKYCQEYRDQTDCLKEAPGCGWDKEKSKCLNIVT